MSKSHCWIFKTLTRPSSSIQTRACSETKRNVLWPHKWLSVVSRMYTSVLSLICECLTNDHITGISVSFEEHTSFMPLLSLTCTHPELYTSAFVFTLTLILLNPHLPVFNMKCHSQRAYCKSYYLMTGFQMRTSAAQCRLTLTDNFSYMWGGGVWLLWVPVLLELSDDADSRWWPLSCLQPWREMR